MSDLALQNQLTVNLALKQRIETLEKYNLGLANESCEQQKRIEELEQANDTLHKLMKNGEARGVAKGEEEKAELKKRIKELETMLYDVLLELSDANHAAQCGCAHPACKNCKEYERLQHYIADVQVQLNQLNGDYYD